MLEVKNASFGDLTEAEQNEQPDNGPGKKYAGYLVVKHNGKNVAVYSDAANLG